MNNGRFEKTRRKMEKEEKGWKILGNIACYFMNPLRVWVERGVNNKKIARNEQEREEKE